MGCRRLPTGDGARGVKLAQDDVPHRRVLFNFKARTSMLDRVHVVRDYGRFRFLFSIRDKFAELENRHEVYGNVHGKFSPVVPTTLDMSPSRLLATLVHGFGLPRFVCQSSPQ